MRLKEPLYGIRTAQMMSVVHFGLAIMMILVERRAILDAEALEAHSAAHASGAAAHAPASHIMIPDGETSFLGLNETI
jgi:hypothetical protein